METKNVWLYLLSSTGKKIIIQVWNDKRVNTDRNFIFRWTIPLYILLILALLMFLRTVLYVTNLSMLTSVTNVSSFYQVMDEFAAKI